MTANRSKLARPNPSFPAGLTMDKLPEATDPGLQALDEPQAEAKAAAPDPPQPVDPSQPVDPPQPPPEAADPPPVTEALPKKKYTPRDLAVSPPCPSALIVQDTP
jgi:hypothetical protein